MAKELQQVEINAFHTGLNTEDSRHDMQDSDLRVADNVIYRPTGEAESIDGLLQVGNDIVVNNVPATKILGGCMFNGSVYLLASNGLLARMMKLNNTTNMFEQVNTTDFDPNMKMSCVIYNDQMWIVNGDTGSAFNGNTISMYFVSQNDDITELNNSKIPNSVNVIALHLERIWVATGNTIYVSRQYPNGTQDDWDLGVVYTGSDAPGEVTLDNNTDDEIRAMVSHFGNLTVFRRERIHVVTGDISLSGTITRAFDSRGTVSPRSVAQADRIMYFLSNEGIKRFDGTSTQDQTLDFDQISSITLDRKIRSEVADLGDRNEIVGHAFKDAYYLSGAGNVILVFDEFTGGFSKWTVGGAEVFIENGENLFCAKANKYYQLNANANASINSQVITKDFNLGSDNVSKIFERLLVTLKAVEGEHTFNIDWYINGSDTPSNSHQLTVSTSGLRWDTPGLTWDSGLRWDTGQVEFHTERIRKLGSGYTIAFGVRAIGTNRFSLSAILFLYEPTRREF